ncbi:MAG: hypothetical protein ACPGQV_11460 [Alphaproteobacteria bacterium]
MIIFATLGPTSSNHELVTERYLALHGLDDVKIVLVENFNDALRRMEAGEFDFIMQVAVHPSATETVAAAHFEHGIYVIDAFISPCRPLAVLTRADVEMPRTLGLQPATERYVDASRWAELVPEISIATVAEGLLAGRFDSGITALDVASEHPGVFKVDQELGSVDDPWIVYGRERASDGGVVAWLDSPASRTYHQGLSR